MGAEKDSETEKKISGINDLGESVVIHEMTNMEEKAILREKFSTCSTCSVSQSFL